MSYPDLPAPVLLRACEQLNDENNQKLKERDAEVKLEEENKELIAAGKPPKNLKKVEPPRPETVEEMDAREAREKEMFSDTDHSMMRPKVTFAKDMVSFERTGSDDLTTQGYDETLARDDVERDTETEEMLLTFGKEYNGDPDREAMIEQMRCEVAKPHTEGFQDTNLFNFNCALCFASDKEYQCKLATYKEEKAAYDRDVGRYWRGSGKEGLDDDDKPKAPDVPLGSPGIRMLDISEVFDTCMVFHKNDKLKSYQSLSNLLKRHFIEGGTVDRNRVVCRDARCEFLGAVLTDDKDMTKPNAKTAAQKAADKLDAGQYRGNQHQVSAETSERKDVREHLRDSINHLMVLAKKKYINKRVFDFELDSLIRTHYYFYERARRIVAKAEGIVLNGVFAQIIGAGDKTFKQDMIFYCKMWYFNFFPKIVNARLTEYLSKGSLCPETWLNGPSNTEILWLNDNELIHAVTRMHIFMKDEAFDAQGNPICKVARGSAAHLLLNQTTIPVQNKQYQSTGKGTTTSKLGEAIKDLLPDSIDVYTADGIDVGHKNAQPARSAIKNSFKIGHQNAQFLGSYTPGDDASKSEGKKTAKHLQQKELQHALNGNRPIFETVKLKSDTFTICGYTSELASLKKTTSPVQLTTFKRHVTFFDIMRVRYTFPKDSKTMAVLVINDQNILQPVVPCDELNCVDTALHMQRVDRKRCLSEIDNSDHIRNAMKNIVSALRSAAINCIKDNADIKAALDCIKKRKSAENVAEMIDSAKDALDALSIAAVDSRDDQTAFDKHVSTVINLRDLLINSNAFTIDKIFVNINAVMELLKDYSEQYSCLDTDRSRTFAVHMKESNGKVASASNRTSWFDALMKQHKNIYNSIKSQYDLCVAAPNDSIDGKKVRFDEARDFAAYRDNPSLFDKEKDMYTLDGFVHVGRVPGFYSVPMDAKDLRIHFANIKKIEQSAKNVDMYKTLAETKPQWLRPFPGDPTISSAGVHIAVRKESKFYTYESWLSVCEARALANNSAHKSFHQRLVEWIDKSSIDTEIEDEFFKWLMSKYGCERARSRFANYLTELDLQSRNGTYKLNTPADICAIREAEFVDAKRARLGLQEDDEELEQCFPAEDDEPEEEPMFGFGSTFDVAERRILSEAPGHASLAFGTTNNKASDPIRDQVMGCGARDAEYDDDDDFEGQLESFLAT